MGKVTINDGNKTVYRYDANARTFKIAALALIGLATVLIVFAVFWIKQFKGL